MTSDVWHYCITLPATFNIINSCHQRRSTSYPTLPRTCISVVELTAPSTTIKTDLLRSTQRPVTCLGYVLLTSPTHTWLAWTNPPTCIGYDNLPLLATCVDYVRPTDFTHVRATCLNPPDLCGPYGHFNYIIFSGPFCNAIGTTWICKRISPLAVNLTTYVSYHRTSLLRRHKRQ